MTFVKDILSTSLLIIYDISRSLSGHNLFKIELKYQLRLKWWNLMRVPNSISVCNFMAHQPQYSLAPENSDISASKSRLNISQDISIFPPLIITKRKKMSNNYVTFLSSLNEVTFNEIFYNLVRLSWKKLEKKGINSYKF